MRCIASPSSAVRTRRRRQWPAAWFGAALAAWFAIAPAHAAPPPATWQAYQRDFHFQQIDDHDGLAQNSVTLVFQDRTGFMWFATQGGLFRFDGYTLSRHTHDPGRVDSLPDDYRIAGLADAGGGRLWVASSSAGLLLFDPGTDAVVPLPDTVVRSSLPPSGVLELPDGGVLVGTRAGLEQVSGEATPQRRAVWALPAGEHAPLHALTRCPDGAIYAAAGNAVVAVEAGLASARILARADAPITALHCTGANALQLGSTAGLAAVDRGSGALRRLWPQVGGTGAGVNAIASDHSDNTWFATTDNRLVRLDARGAETTIAPAPAGITGGLPDSPIYGLYVDRTGLLWVATLSSGVVWTNPEGNPIEAVLNLSGDPRVRAFVRNFLQAPDGSFWVAMSGPGLIHYDPASHRVTSHQAALLAAIRSAPPAGAQPAATGASRAVADDDLRTHGDFIRTFGIVAAPGGRLLLATGDGLVEFNPAAGTARFAELDGQPARVAVRALLRARDGSLWMAPRDAGLVRYRDGRTVQHFGRAQGLAADDVRVIAEDRAGNIWAGTLDGVSRVDPLNGKIRSFREVAGRDDSLAGNAIVSLLGADDGSVWIGSLSGISQLQSIDAAGARFRRYGLKDGLPDDTIYCMLQDGAGRIWASTNLGLGRLDPRTGALRSFGIADGIQSNEYNATACLRTADGRLLFGGHGFDIIDPAAIRPVAERAPLVFTSLLAGKAPVPLPDHAGGALSLGAETHSLYATFATLDFAAPGQNRYRYRLLGRSSQWSAPTREHRVAYANLTPGNYRLEVQSIRRDGSPGESASLALHVESAWWWRPGMRAAYGAAAFVLVLILLLGWRSHHVEQVRHRRQLQLRESRLRQALWGSGDEFWDWNLEQGTILRLGPEGGPGGHHEESISADAWRRTRVHPDDLKSFDAALAEHLAGRTEHFEVEHRVRSRDGEWTWVLSRGKVVERDAGGKPLRICGTERDMSSIRVADRDRRIASEVIRNMSEAVAVTDLDFAFVSVNAAFTRMTGYSEAEVLGRDAAVLNGSRRTPDLYAHVRQALAETGHWRGELWQRRKDGEEFLCWVELNEVRDAAGRRTHMIAVMSDITDRKRAEQELRYLANYDTLTGLPNRALLGERLGAAVISARRSGHKVGLLFLDLDRFKHVNDSLGHTAGDRTLKAAGARLRQCVRENDVVARLGGDEFTVVLEELTDVRGAEDMARRLIQAFTKPLAVSGTQETVISPSIGIALYPDHGQTPADLLKCADTAMYQAKAGGRNTWAVYHAGMDARARDHATLISALRRALDRNELHLVYQPKMAIDGESITGMEALLRWHNPDLGEISPSVFIPLAEETGQIHEISTFVFSTACADLRRFREQGHRHLTMAINLSAAQLNRPDLTVHICDLLAEHDIAPNQVELELTESMVMANAEQSLRLLGELKSIGTRLAIDDFGTGYSSLAYLKRLPIDTLKIDQTFVGDITTDPDDAAITSTIITLAHALQVRVVAEGVETIEQLAFLRNQRCDEIQGYWLSQPLSADDCLDFLNRHAAAAVAG